MEQNYVTVTLCTEWVKKVSCCAVIDISKAKQQS